MTTIISECKYCKQEIQRSFLTIREAVLNSRTPVYCNDDHRRLYEEYRMQWSGKIPDYTIPTKHVREQWKKQKLIKFDPTMDICYLCRVKNKDCERIQSDFVIIPEGARFNKNGKICECPNFKL